MTWDAERKLAEVMDAPIGVHVLRADTEVVNRDGWYRLRTPSTPLPSVNEILRSAIDERDPDADIDRVVAAYRADDLPLKWLVYPWSRPADLGDRLSRRGAIHWKCRGMACDTGLAIEPAPNSSIERIDRHSLATYVDAMAAGWEMPAVEAATLSTNLRAQLDETEATVQLFVVRSEGRVAGTAATFIKPESGYLMGANVLPAYRGRGLYRTLLHARLAALRVRGISLATTHAREQTSAPILSRLGFESVFHYAIYLLNPRLR